jgi:hypothetical protein
LLTDPKAVRHRPFLSAWLERLPPQLFSAYCIAASFGTYFCMYAFRKPFTAGTFEDVYLGGVGYKTVLVVSQVLGYTLSKFIGIKVVSEMPPSRRAWGIIALIGAAHLALLLFAVIPPPYNFPMLFLNGLPLGMVFGLVLGFLEGRQVTEMLTAGLCASFILSSGAVKSVGQYLILRQGVSEYWMPFLTGSLFLPLLVLCVWLLAQIPPPNHQDVALRSKRDPMSYDQRSRFFRKHFIGLILFIVVYLLLTILRSLRDDFAVEIWAALGTTGQPEVFAQSEMVVMLGVILVNGAACFIRNNRTAFLTATVTIVAGFTTMLAATLAFRAGLLSSFSFMVALGLGSYIPYVAFHTTLFERLIATFREQANLNYLIYLVDAYGYLGYVAILLWRNFGTWNVDFLRLLEEGSLFVGGVSILLMSLSGLYFLRRLARHHG